MTDNRKELKKALDSLFLSVASSIAWDVQQKVDAVIAELEAEVEYWDKSFDDRVRGTFEACRKVYQKNEKLEAAGDQLMRAVEYTSGTSLEFAVKEWKAARNEQP